MDRLPDEVVLHILSFLETTDIVHFQKASHRYVIFGRDNALWKIETFNHSRAEELRRRQRLLNAQDSRLAELRNAVSALPGGNLTAWDVSQLRGSVQPRASSDPQEDAKTLRSRALANWEPGYPGEKLDYYEEFIHRHAAINVGWLSLPSAQIPDKDAQLEATGIATITDSQTSRQNRVVVPLDDASVAIWDISARSTLGAGGAGKLIAQSERGLLTGQPAGAASENHMIMTETGAVECVAVDSVMQKGFFAVQNHVHEVNLATLQIVSTKQYPWPVTALSEAKPETPITIGTNWTVHLHDPRDPAFAAVESTSGGELIGGSVYSHAILSQPGPLSIVHDSSLPGGDDSIWVAGRFTSLLNYDRRFFPRLRGNIHSGARIASLSSLPHPFVPRELDLVRNPRASVSALSEARNRRGSTILAAAEYKGKGSLELFGIPDSRSYQNRQTASASKLLSVAPHGGRIVFSDGDGNVKWVERDGFSHVRTFNINDRLVDTTAQDTSAYGIWSSTGSELPGQGDIVQKIIPTQNTASHLDTNSGGRLDVNQANLLIWTGDGALGMLGFGPSDPLGPSEEWHDAVESLAESAEQKAKEDAERQYGMAMRRALERNADEVRFVRGLGMGMRS